MKEGVPMNERDRSSFSVNIRKEKILEYFGIPPSNYLCQIHIDKQVQIHP